MKLPPVFLTYGWCRVSYVILRSLARQGVEVHVGDTSPLSMCRVSRFSSSFTRHRSPWADPDGFVDDVARALERLGASVLIPGHEDVSLLVDRWDRLPTGVRMAAPPPDALRIAVNKSATQLHAASVGVHTPMTVVPGGKAELSSAFGRVTFPAVIKPQRGNSAKGVAIVGNQEEGLSAYVDIVHRYGLDDGRWPLIQAHHSGDGYGVCVLYAKGTLRTAFCERYLRLKDGAVGTSVMRESVYAPELIDCARAVFDPLGWHGVAHVDFLWDRNGPPALIEINPRFWGALDLAVRSGIDFPWLLYRLALDGDVEAPACYREGVRSRWVAGEAIHLVNAARRGPRSAARAFRRVLSERADGSDDARWDDPIPLLVELLYYAIGYLRSGDTNPTEPGMIG